MWRKEYSLGLTEKMYRRKPAAHGWTMNGRQKVNTTKRKPEGPQLRRVKVSSVCLLIHGAMQWPPNSILHIFCDS